MASKFVLYDNGENYKKKGIAFRDIRKEHGAFILRYDPCNEGDIRRMTVILPALTKVPISEIQNGLQRDSTFPTTRPAEKAQNGHYLTQLDEIAKILVNEDSAVFA